MSPDIPWHVTAFHKDYKMTDPADTTSQMLVRAAAIGNRHSRAVSHANWAFAEELVGIAPQLLCLVHGRVGVRDKPRPLRPSGTVRRQCWP